jgi:hypothetical protein
MALTKVVDGIHIDLTPQEEADVRAKWAAEDKRVADDQAINGHKYKRAPNYPHIHDQLDMLWHAMDSGEIPKAKDFYNAIAKVKTDYPKPNTAQVITVTKPKRFFGRK